MEWIVGLDKITPSIYTTYIAPWTGDPGRTCIKESAKRYKSAASATFALAHARKYRNYPDAQIIPVQEENNEV